LTVHTMHMRREVVKSWHIHRPNKQAYSGVGFVNAGLQREVEDSSSSTEFHSSTNITPAGHR